MGSDPRRHLRVEVRQIFDQHADFVWRVLARAGVRDADLKDALQEVFIIVTQKLDQLDTETKTTTWLYGISIRVAANHRRKIQRKREDFGAIDETTVPDPSKNPEEIAAQEQAREQLARLLDGLSADQRIVFEMFELEEMTCPAISESLGIPLGTVYTRLRAARAALVARARTTRPNGGNS